MKASIRALFVLVAALDGCGAPGVDSAAAKQHYLTAKDRCVAEYPNSLVRQSDCRTQAANLYIRPFYKYGDLMTRAQEQRRALAVKADRHEITRKTYDRQIAQSEATIAREEERRDNMTGTASVQDSTPFANFFEAVAGWLR